MPGAVAITGLGHTSALGGDVPALARELVAGRCAIGPLTRFAHRGRAPAIAAEVAALAPVGLALPPAGARRLSRADRLALAVADEAGRMAGLDDDLRRRAAIAVGATTSGMLETEEAYRRWRAGEQRRVRFSRFLGMPLSTAAAAVSQGLGMFGPRATVSTACSSGALAIVAAAGMVARGEAPVALALGVDVLCRLTYAGFDALQAIDPEPCRPFDVTRRGLSLGEGAAALVLEPLEQARARGARVIALLLGAGVSADAHHVTAPHPAGTGALAAMRSALAAAAVVPEAIDYVNAHGSGTKQNDEVEVGVLRAVFGARLPRVPVSSTKSQLGHCLGAAGAIEAVTTVVALADGILPSTVTLRTPDPAWQDLDLVPTPGRRAPLGIAVSSSYGFGGHNVTLVFARPEVRA
jgi:3-oxoacyl-[acyl-carrier-protein] synthase II